MQSCKLLINCLLGRAGGITVLEQISMDVTSTSSSGRSSKPSNTTSYGSQTMEETDIHNSSSSDKSRNRTDSEVVSMDETLASQTMTKQSMEEDDEPIVKRPRRKCMQLFSDTGD